MIQALFYKEWIKTRRIILLVSVIFTGTIVYTFINFGQLFRIRGAVQAWADVILKDAALLSGIIEWIPLLAGILLGLAQFVPEMEYKRLKLTMHLPLTESRIISVMLLYGIMVLVSFYLLGYGCLLAGTSIYYPSEIVEAMVEKSLPWFLGGFAGYLFSAWVCFEPVWRQRIINAFAAVCALSFFYIASGSGTYIPFIPYLIVLIIVAFSFPFYSAIRFKEGVQK